MMRRRPSASAGARYRLHPDVVWIARPDGSSRLMHMSANVCAIDAESSALLTSILEAGPEGAASALAVRARLGEAEARDEVDDFIAGLRGQKLIRSFADRRSWLDRARDGAARALVAGVVRLVDRPAGSLRGKVRGLLWAARWAVAQFGWARAVREWERNYPQPAAGAPTSAEQLEAIDEAVRQAASRSLIGVECKERSLVCLALARRRGIRAHMIVGVSHNPMQGHVWVEAEGRVISDDPDHWRSFEPVARYG
jgi:hypothetical protein